MRACPLAAERGRGGIHNRLREIDFGHGKYAEFLRPIAVFAHLPLFLALTCRVTARGYWQTS